VIEFRASMAGACIRKLALYGAAPDDPAFTAPPNRQRFLQAGHTIQAQLVDELRSTGEYDLNPQGVEAEGRVEYPELGFALTGHVDGHLAIPEVGELLEVKAITKARYDKMIDAPDWRALYPQYVAPAQVYMHMPELVLPANVVGGPFKAKGPFYATRMLFACRDSFNMLGGFDVDNSVLPAYAYREDMIEVADKALYEKILERHAIAATYAEHGDVPDECDAEGWCFHCQTWGSLGTGPTKGRIIHIPHGEEGFDHAFNRAQDYTHHKMSVDAHGKESKRLRLEILAWMEEEDPKAAGFDFECEEGSNQLISIRRSEMRRTYPDKEAIAALVSAGEIGKTGSTSEQLRVTTKDA
jgi:hypothetical protein